MDAAKLREILKTQYGIKDDEEFDAAVEKSSGVNLGLFTMPLMERSRNGNKKAEAVTA